MKNYPEIETRFHYQSPGAPAVLLLGAVANGYEEGKKFGQWLIDYADCRFVDGLEELLQEWRLNE